MGGGRRCPNDCAAVQGLWLTRCVSRNVTLAHATWSKVHSNSFDAGWRPFAPAGNLTLALDMNLGDRKVGRDVGVAGCRNVGNCRGRDHQLPCSARSRRRR